MLTNNGDEIKAAPTPTKILYALAYKVITTKMIVKTKQDDLARPSITITISTITITKNQTG